MQPCTGSAELVGLKRKKNPIINSTLCFVTGAFLGWNRRCRCITGCLTLWCVWGRDGAWSITLEMASSRLSYLCSPYLSSLFRIPAYSQQISFLLSFLEKLPGLFLYGNLFLFFLVLPVPKVCLLASSPQTKGGSLCFSLCLIKWETCCSCVRGGGLVVMAIL